MIGNKLSEQLRIYQLITMTQKVILASLLIIISLPLKSQELEEKAYEVINEILSNYQEGVVDKKIRPWRKNYFSSINPESYATLGISKYSYSFDLDSIFTEEQQIQITEKLNLYHNGKGPSKLKPKKVNSGVRFKKIKSKTDVPVTQVTYPIISQGKEGCQYAIIEVRSSFKGEGSGKLKYYRKCENKWLLIYELVTYLS